MTLLRSIFEEEKWFLGSKGGTYGAYGPLSGGLGNGERGH